MGSSLAAEIEQKLCNDGLDNGANMAGKYSGMQARLKQVNNLA